MVTTLLERGADINATDEHGWTPLMWAAWSGLPKVVGILLEKGAEVTPADRQGNTALIIAARRGQADIVEGVGWFEPLTRSVLGEIVFVNWLDACGRGYRLP